MFGKICRKNFMFYVFRSLFLFSFPFICFSCRFSFDFSRSPSQHASLSKCLPYLCISSFLFIPFPSVLSFLSPLVFSFLSPFLPLSTSFFWSFLLSPCFFMSNSLWKNYLFKLLRNSFFCLLFPQKNFVFPVSLLLFFFLTVIYFSMFCFFPVLKNGFSFFITRLISILLFNSVALFFYPF